AIGRRGPVSNQSLRNHLVSCTMWYELLELWQSVVTVMTSSGSNGSSSPLNWRTFPPSHSSTKCPWSFAAKDFEPFDVQLPSSNGKVSSMCSVTVPSIAFQTPRGPVRSARNRRFSPSALVMYPVDGPVL